MRVQIERHRADDGGSVDAAHHRSSLVAGSLLAARWPSPPRLSRAADWRPLSLLGLLLVLAVGSDAARVEIRGLRLSGAFLAIVLAMALLGPAPAVALGVACVAGRRASSRGARSTALLVNIATFAMFPLLGGLAIDALRRLDAPRRPARGSPRVVLVVFLGTNALNFALIAAATRLRLPRAGRERCCARSCTALPSEFATALLTAGVAFTYAHIGMASVGLAAVVLFVFLYILRTSVQAQERGEELEQAHAASSRRCRSGCSRRCCRRSRCATR